MTELVVLADSSGQPAGVADKATVHSEDTPLHFAFSAYVIRPDGKTLVTRRALSKKAWPGVWTNSFCGHPGPEEATVDAVYRRARQELGITEEDILEVSEVLPDFSYRAVDSSGIVEWELCPVFVVQVREQLSLDPNPEEVDSWDWMTVASLIDVSRNAPMMISPWAVEELEEPRLRQALTSSEPQEGLD